MNSLRGASAWAARDPMRPRFHFRPPALWMNDPNGPIWHGGWYHMLYQHNPFGDRWSDMHWGHARSRDLVTWEHQPVALLPTEERGEEGVWSGCTAVDDQGRVKILYTSIRRGQPARDYAEQWVAVAENDDLVTWDRGGRNPVHTPSNNGSEHIREWRDPFVFDHGGHGGARWMVLGGNVEIAPGRPRGCVALYRALDGSLERWQYRGPLFVHPDADVENIEMPVFFPLGHGFALIISPPHLREWFVGDFDGQTGQFTPRERGVLNWGAPFYAPAGLRDARGRWVMWGWVRGWPEGRGWSRCLTLPRVVSLSRQGRVQTRPLPELARLRGRLATRISDESLTGPGIIRTSLPGRQTEIALNVSLGSLRSLRLGILSREGRELAVVRWDSSGHLSVNEAVAELGELDSETLALHLFLDGGVLDVYAGQPVAVTQILRDSGVPATLAIRGEGGEGMLRNLEIWPMTRPSGRQP